jgi:hypothetical protein
MHRHASTVGRFATVALATAAFAAGHGALVKPCYNVEETLAGRWENAKTNATVRGSVKGGEAVQLYMMDPHLNRTGTRQVIGYRAILQDEEAFTQELVELSFVRYAAGGVLPDETPAGVISKATFAVFGFVRGQIAFDFTLIMPGGEITAPANMGVGVLLPARASWPADGLTVHGQLNLPGHPLRPRLTPPFDDQVWAFERPASWPAAQPLGGRKLDTLLVAAIYWQEPVLKTYVMSNAYGSGPEMLFGPESMHPVAARGDALGFHLQGGNDGELCTAYFLLSTGLSPSPFEYAPASGNKLVYLAFTGNMPVLLMTGVPDPNHGRLTTSAIPFAWFPPIVRAELWVQALLHYPLTGLVRLTDAVGVKVI